MHEELETAHPDASFNSMLACLGRVEVVVQEPLDVLEEAKLGLQEVYPGKQIEDEMALPVICLLEHVQGRVWLAVLHMSDYQKVGCRESFIPGESRDDTIYVFGPRGGRKCIVFEITERWLV